MDTIALDRREWLSRTGAVAAFASLWSAQASAADSDRHHSRADLVVEVACLGETFSPVFPGPPYAPKQSTPPPDVGGTDSRGASFFVEGLIYHAGTIPDGAGFDPASASGGGVWLCRGWFMSHTGRVHPHVVTTQEYLFGLPTAAQPSPAHTLVSSGVEGGIALAHRAVIGGSGRHRHARGDVQQLTIGTNTTEILPGVFAPNFRFFFRV